MSPEEDIRDTKTITDLEQLEERLRELRLFNLEERRLQADLTADFQYLNRVFKKDGDNLFIAVCCNKMRANLVLI